MKNDPRITSIGRILRKTSLDEIPQLWAVIKGDMSYSRAASASPVEVAECLISERRRLDVTPGITCIWQVSGRSDIPFEKQVKLDLQYIESQSFWLDILLLLKTIPAVLFGKGPINNASCHYCYRLPTENGPFIRYRPTPLLNVADRPIIFYIIEFLVRHGIIQYDLIFKSSS